jgi:hypothetical protein
MPMRWVRQNCGNGLKTQSLSMVRQILGVPARAAKSPVHWMLVSTLTSTLFKWNGSSKGGGTRVGGLSLYKSPKT